MVNGEDDAKRRGKKTKRSMYILIEAHAKQSIERPYRHLLQLYSLCRMKKCQMPGVKCYVGNRFASSTTILPKRSMARSVAKLNSAAFRRMKFENW